MSARPSARETDSAPADPDPGSSVGGSAVPVKRPVPRPSKAQRAYLARGLDQPGGKLPLFDHNGRRVSARTVQACLDNGWAESWFANPLKPDWQVCRLTAEGRRAAGES
ncbi:hypothetical protein SAMN05421720_10874 [Rhodospira trueperi]|uniref:Uncharacterized protein n=1 Tax=Rhodospira trueperi TaxID=69960 RepID=A0A1G7DXP5_9PROT|nr:hypothetical protein SAMN05421720_10874 [Rhodospira trueperi]